MSGAAAVRVCGGAVLARDPHHQLDVEWKYERGRFYQRHDGQSKWTQMKRAHITPARVRVLARMVEEAERAALRACEVPV